MALSRDGNAEFGQPNKNSGCFSKCMAKFLMSGNAKTGTGSHDPIAPKQLGLELLGNLWGLARNLGTGWIADSC